MRFGELSTTDKLFFFPQEIWHFHYLLAFYELNN